MKVTKEMVDRFLTWRLPQEFHPDCGVTFKPSSTGEWPVGTNLLTATQAQQMLEHVLSLPQGGEMAEPGVRDVEGEILKDDRSGWAHSLYNCTTGANYLRTQEYYDLIQQLDRDARLIDTLRSHLAAARQPVPGMAELIAELDALEAKATPGPWTVEVDGSHEQRNTAVVVRGDDGRQMLVYGQILIDDAEFITEFRNAYPKLRAAAQAGRGAVEKAWLIESVNARWGTGYFWRGLNQFECWGTIDKAVRFARKQDAEAVIDSLQKHERRYGGTAGVYEACEHEWADAARGEEA